MKRCGSKVLSVFLTALLVFLMVPLSFADANSVRDTIMNVAKGEIGYEEGGSNYNKYGEAYGLNYQPWCVIFVWWCAQQVGVGTDVIPKTASVRTMYEWFDARGCIYGPSSGYTPKHGDLVFFDWPDVSGPHDHIGFVDYVSGSTVYTVEGNTSLGNGYDGVASKARSAYIEGYACPNYGDIIPPDPPQDWPQYPSYPGYLIKKSSSYDWNAWWVQNTLQDIGYDCGWSGADGVFGTDTYNAVKSFQSYYGLEVDGVVGEETWNMLLWALHEKYPTPPSYSNLSLNTGSIVNVNDVITFTASSDTATEYCLGIDKDGNRIYTSTSQANNTFSYTCQSVGLYSAYVTSSNSAGYKDSARVYWQVVSSTPTRVAETSYNGHSYTVYLSNLNWKEAKAWCENKGGYLATITEKGEQDTITSLLGNHKNGNYWLGAENEKTGEYKWVTCEPFKYTCWCDGQPDCASNNEHYLGTLTNAKWNDFAYNSTVSGFIMETGTVTNASHTWNNGTVTVSATCAAEGVKSYTCSVCGETKTESIEKDLSNHTGGTEVRNAKAATCGAAGYTGDIYCKGCGAKLKTGSTIAATGKHTWDGGVVTASATCSAAGVKTYTCTVCNTTKTEAISKDASNHTGGTEVRNAVPATCGTEGYTGDTYCKGCGAKLKTGSTIAATGKHTWDSGVVITSATCVVAGLRTYTCTVCKTTRSEQIRKDPSNHIGGTEVRNTVAATCGAAGYTGDTYCKGCSALLTEGETIEPTGAHTWNSGEVIIVPTCAAEGAKTFTCTVCGVKNVTVVKDPANHTGETEVKNAVEATCGKPGYTGDTYCKGCGMLLTEGVTIEPTGAHTWNGGEVTTAPTYNTPGEKTYTCTVCGETKTESIDPIPQPADPDAVITVASVKAQPGKTEEVAVDLTGYAPMSYLLLGLEYDKTALTLTGAKNGGLFDTFENGASLLLNSGSDIAEGGCILTLTFTVSETAAAGEYPITVICRQCYNNEEENLLVKVNNGAITVFDVMIGDITGDGTVDGRDLIRLRKYLANLDETTGECAVEIVSAAADCTGDGAIDGRDLIRLRKYLANLDETTGESTITLG